MNYDFLLHTLKDFMSSDRSTFKTHKLKSCNILHLTYSGKVVYLKVSGGGKPSTFNWDYQKIILTYIQKLLWPTSWEVNCIRNYLGKISKNKKEEKP